MIITSLDSEKAFDKVQHCRLWIALRRLGIHDAFVEVLKDCYVKASFFVEDEYGTSTAKMQSAGIRQGCPISPYLFVLLMSVVDRDVALNLDTAYQRRNPNKLPVQRIYYADDTVLISTNTAAANRLLAEVEGVSKQFGIRLNRNKCCYISLNGNNVVKFPDGRKLNRVEKTTYLGHHITQEMDVKHEVQHKMHQTLKIWFNLDTFWRTTVCSIRWKLQVYDAIIRNNAAKESECISIAGPA